jgi:Kef-type K+ transport system membrane component KefB
MVLPTSLSGSSVPVSSFALFLGVAMSVTAFPVLARILTERGLVRTRVGAMALAAAAVDDVAAWCLLALVVGIASATGALGALVTVGCALAYSAGIWLVARPLLARLGPRHGNEVSVELVAVAVLLVVGSAYLTEKIGIHALFGGFLIGAAMPRSGGLSAALSERLGDFVTVVMLPLFFAYSGLRTHVGLLATYEDWAITAVLFAVAIAGKFVGAGLAARLTGFGSREAVAIGVLMNTRGLMEIVVLNVGLDLGVIGDRMFTMMVLVALATTWMTSPLLRRAYPREVAGAEVSAPIEQSSKPLGILIGVSDPRIAGPLALLAQALRSQDEPVWIVHLRPVERPHDYLRADDSDEQLTSSARAAELIGLEPELISFPSSEPGADLVRVAALKRVRLVLLGAHRSALIDDDLGGVAGEVLAQADATVGILDDRGLASIQTVRTDAFGEHSEAVRGLAERLRWGGAEVREMAPEDGPVDLKIRGYHRDAPPPRHPKTSLLLVRGPRAGGAHAPETKPIENGA